GLWWKETEHQLGREACIAVEREAWDRWFPLQMSRLGKVLGFEVQDGVPKTLIDKSETELKSLLEAISVNWLAQDGLWFQAVENRCDLATAQRANDTAWSRFSPFEVGSIKSILNLPDDGGLDALEQAMHYRLYAFINRYTIERPNARTLILHMNDCRVQSARKRRGLADYPCKSGGTVEYTTFAQAIDPRIVTRCIGCAPDPHPDEWYCAWEFTLPRE
ncbi:MAG TPA: DUF6125 family protein, partial [Acidobacteriota bacterium]|nr:DUF6125 family protein [Acidobacteriota bacterium]